MFLKLFPRYAGRAHRGLGSGLVVSDPSLGLSADVRVRMLLVHEAEGFRNRGVSGFHAPFRLRRRGVETKLVLGNPTKSVDRTLLRNIANAVLCQNSALLK